MEPIMGRPPLFIVTPRRVQKVMDHVVISPGDVAHATLASDIDYFFLRLENGNVYGRTPADEYDIIATLN